MRSSPVDDQSLVLSHVVLLTQQLEKRRHLGLEALTQSVPAHVFVTVVAPREDVERALPVTGLDIVELSNLGVGEERTSRHEAFQEVWTVAVLTNDGLASSDATPETHDDHVRTLVGGSRRRGPAIGGRPRLPEQLAGRQSHGSEAQQSSTDKLSTSERRERLGCPDSRP